MSENKLIARNKFVSKVEGKITKLNKALRLLTKIDHLLFINQSGGTIMHNMGVSIADLEARGSAWRAALDSTTDLQVKLTELESGLADYQTKIDGVLTSIGTPKLLDLTPFDKFKLLDQNVYDAAKAAVLAALEMHKPGKSQATEGAALTTAIGVFDAAVDAPASTIIAADKQGVKDLLKAKTDAIKAAAP